jgi:cytosine/adenosine deaminase-related metal-dependent hydrolase
MVFPGHVEAVMTDLMVRDASISGASGLVDIDVAGGLIRSIEPAMGRTAETTIDCAGRVVIPGSARTARSPTPSPRPES